MLASFSESPNPGTYRKDRLFKCCGCKRRHMESERRRIPPGRDGLRYTACPKCGATSYYDMTDAGKENAK